MATVNLKIIKPDRIYIEEDFEHVIIPGVEGDIDILPAHAPYITQIRPGIISVFQNGEKKEYSIHDGFVTVENDKIVIVTDKIESPDEIDVERAEKAKQRAEERLKATKSDIDYRRAELALRRALARIEITHGKR